MDRNTLFTKISLVPPHLPHTFKRSSSHFQCVVGGATVHTVVACFIYFRCAFIPYYEDMGRAFVLSLSEITLLSAALLGFGYFAGRFRSSAAPTGGSAVAASQQQQQQQQAFVLLVNLKFTTLDHRDTFLQLIDPVCKDVLANEGPSSKQSTSSTSTETTLSYKVAISDKNPLMVIVMERYSDKERGYLDIHRSGKEFQKFREKLKKMQEEGHVIIEGESYLETELGYV